MDNIRVAHVGAARVTLVNAGDMTVRMADEYGLPEFAYSPEYAEAFGQPQRFPSLSALIELDGVTTLVDANDYRAAVTPDSGYYTPDYTPPPPIAAQLASLGMEPGDVAHLVITHAHWDHFAGVTQAIGAQGEPEPVYPRARVYLGHGDWDDAEMSANIQRPDSLEARTLGVVHARGLLELVSEEREIAPGVTIIPAPGETPGHQIVRVQSKGETLYILGDLIHHEAEASHPDWMVTWAEPGTMRASKASLFERALRENALLTAAHIGSLGRLARTAGGVVWRQVN